MRPSSATFFAAEEEFKASAGQDLPEEFTVEFGQEFRLIPAGSFMMGNTKTPEEIDEKYPGGAVDFYDDAPRHEVTLSRSYYIGKRLVPKGEFAKFVKATGYKTTAEKEGSDDAKGVDWRSPGFEQDDAHLVVCVRYGDAQAYVSG